MTKTGLLIRFKMPVFPVNWKLHFAVSALIHKMDDADYICGFQTYPHVDQFQTGVRLAKLVFDHLTNGTKSYLARAAVPMIVPASGYTTGEKPMCNLIGKAQAMVRSGAIKDFTIFMMQPWLDVTEAASTVITIGDDAQTARKCAETLAQELYSFRDELWPKLYSIDETIQIAKNNVSGRPVVLVDFADSPGGGALGDSSIIVDVLQQQNFPVSTLTIVSDPESVFQAEQIGAGGEGDFLLGGKLTGLLLKPTAVHAQVRSLHDGVFYQKGPVGTGQRRNLGRTAVLSVNNIDIVVCEHACGCGDPEVYRAFGVEPSAYQLVVVKANTSFRAAYQDFVHDIIMTATPGSCSADLRSLPFTHLPKPFYPISEVSAGVNFDADIYLQHTKC